MTICRCEGLILEIAFGFVTCLNGFNGIVKLIPNLIVFLKNLIEPFGKKKVLKFYTTGDFDILLL